jgi:hypothetical protein
MFQGPKKQEKCNDSVLLRLFELPLWMEFMCSDLPVGGLDDMVLFEAPFSSVCGWVSVNVKYESSRFQVMKEPLNNFSY